MSEQSKAIPETVTPDGLRIRAQLMRAAGYESCARHLELAADEIASLRAQLASARKALQEIVARTYSTDRRCRLDYEPVAEICDIAKAALSDEEGK